VKLQLELGGNNPAVVLADADLDLAATEITKAAMRQTGQRCTATSRAFVERKVADQVLERFVAAVSALRVGDPAEPSTDVGRLASQAQFDSVVTHLKQGPRAGPRAGLWRTGDGPWPRVLRGSDNWARPNSRQASVA
jgi:aldehyde dehydrogenase (NAD+)